MPIIIFMTKYYHNYKPPCRFNSVSHNFFKTFRLALFALIVLLLNSCEQNPTKIGSGLLPGSDFVAIESTDTISAPTYTDFDDSTRTDSPSVSYLGQLYDPYFGTTTAGFVSQIRLGSKWDGLPFHIDSVKLYLHLLTVQGGADVIHTIKLSEIANIIYPDSAYYSNTPVPLTGYEVDDIQLPVLKADTVNDIVLNLPLAFGNYLTRDTSKLFYNNSMSDFRSYFRGLYFSMYSSSDPLLVSLSVAQPAAGNSYANYITLYMHNDSDIQKVYNLDLDAVNKNASFNIFTHDFSTATLGSKMVHRNTPFKDTLSYVQCLNGVFTRIELTSLESLKTNPAFRNIEVNKARLIIPAYLDESFFTSSTVPSQLYLRYDTRSGPKIIVPDYSINASFFDGVLDTTANVYNFNIPDFVQNYLKDATGDLKPELEIFSGISGTQNLILKANKNKTPVKFEFTYTKF